MQLKDKVQFIGDFSIKSIYADGTFDEYKEQNLIMDNARSNMAQLIGGVNTGGGFGTPINKIVLGTQGHIGTDILAFKVAGVDYASTQTKLFSETAVTGGLNYAVTFNTIGDVDVTDSVATGQLFNIDVSQIIDAPTNTVQRVVTDRTVTYTITIKSTNGNAISAPPNDIIAYTEAALYAGTDIFSMKTFPARVKESTVELVITWSIIF